MNPPTDPRPGDHRVDKTDVIRPEVEILPADPSGLASPSGNPWVWEKADAQGFSRRVTVVKPGPIATVLFLLVFGAILAASVVLAVGLFAIFLGVSAISAVAFLVHRALKGVTGRTR
jgi:hypothetical protein